MLNIVKDLLEKAKQAESIEAMRAYIDAALLVSDNQGKAIVTLESTNNMLINAVKTVQNATGWGLKESKEFVEKAPIAFESMPFNKANALHRLLTNEGFLASISKE